MLTARLLADRVNAHPDDRDISTIVQAVNEFVELGCPHATYITTQTGQRVWSATTQLGALMLAARWFQRRNTASGVESVTEAGGVYIARHDPDIARLLRLDQFAPPAIG